MTGTLLGSRKTLVVFTGLLLGLLIAGLGQTTVAVAAPTIVQDLGGLSDLPWVFTANLIAAAVGAPLFGRLSDLYGRRMLFNVALVLFLAGSAACALAQNVPQLGVCRAVQGLGAGGLTAMAIVIVGDIVSPRARAAYQGYIGAELAVAQVIGPWLGGYLTDAFSWRWVFLVNLPIGITALVVTATTLKVPSPRERAAVDWAGAALLVVALSCLMLVFSWGGRLHPWTSGPIVALVAATLVALAAFVLVERRAAEPIMPLRLFANPVAATALVLVFFAGAGLLTMTFYMPALLQIVIGMSATSSGLLLFPLQAGVVVTSVVSGHVVAATGRYREAYFSVYPGVWRHGDWLTITSRGTAIIHGRSDSTLNRRGVRMGSSDLPGRRGAARGGRGARGRRRGTRRRLLDAAVRTAGRRSRPGRRADRPDPRGRADQGLAAARAGRGAGGARDPAHRHRQEAGGPGQAHPPGRAGRAGLQARRGRRPGGGALVRGARRTPYLVDLLSRSRTGRRRRRTAGRRSPRSRSGGRRPEDPSRRQPGRDRRPRGRASAGTKRRPCMDTW